MENLYIFIGVLAVLILLTKLFSKEKKPSGNCRNCPEFRYCGGRPRCARRNETI